MVNPLDKETFGSRLYALRRRAKLKQAELGAKLGVAGATISRWESGQILPEQEHVEAVCAAFNVKESYFEGIASVSEAPQQASPDLLRGVLRSLAALDDSQLRRYLDLMAAELAGSRGEPFPEPSNAPPNPRQTPRRAR